MDGFVLTLSGQPAQIKVARAQVQALLDTHQASTAARVPAAADTTTATAADSGASTVAVEPVSETISVPISCVGWIVGRRGATVKGLRARTGTQIQVSRNLHDSDVLVTGEREAVERAVQELQVCEILIPGNSSVFPTRR